MPKLKCPNLLMVILIVFLCSLFVPPEVLAAKPRVWKTTQKSTATSVTRPTYSVKLRSDRRALNVNFYNLQSVKSVSYELTYIGNNLEQGVVGSIYKKEGNSAYRLLLFGTCSKNVCTYHKNIRNTQLLITAKLNSGQTLIKRYKIKV